MASKVQIFNRALNLLGEPEISSVTEDNKRAKALLSAWELLVPELMFMKPWLFTVKEQRLSRLDMDGITDYQYAYRYPTDAVVMLAPVGNGIIIKIMGDVIYSNTDSLTVQYCKQEDDISKWSIGFQRCLSYMLAIECCYKLIESNTREANLTNAFYGRILPNSIETDTLQQTPEQVINVMVAGGYED